MRKVPRNKNLEPILGEDRDFDLLTPISNNRDNMNTDTSHAHCITEDFSLQSPFLSHSQSFGVQTPVSPPFYSSLNVANYQPQQDPERMKASFFLNEERVESSSIYSSQSKNPSSPSYMSYTPRPRTTNNSDFSSFYVNNEKMHSPPSSDPLPFNPSDKMKRNARLHHSLDWHDFSDTSSLSSSYPRKKLKAYHNHSEPKNPSSNDYTPYSFSSENSYRDNPVNKRRFFTPKNTITPPIEMYKKREVHPSSEPFHLLVSSKEPSPSDIFENFQKEVSDSFLPNIEEKTMEELFLSEFSTDDPSFSTDLLSEPFFDLSFPQSPPQSVLPTFTCPICSEANFTEENLIQHVLDKHSRRSEKTAAVCPVCSSKPNGDPNYVSRDFYAHVKYRHIQPKVSRLNSINNSSSLKTSNEISMKKISSLRANSQPLNLITRSHCPMIVPRLSRNSRRVAGDSEDFWEMILALDCITSNIASTTLSNNRPRRLSSSSSLSDSGELSNSNNNNNNTSGPKCDECKKEFKTNETCEVYSCHHVFHDYCAQTLNHIHQNSLCPHCNLKERRRNNEKRNQFIIDS